MVEALAVLERRRVPVERFLERYLPRRGEPSVFYASVWELLDRGGKRFRPAIALLACEAVGGDSGNAVPAAAAVELLHNMTLVHDDIEDESELRRGKPCIHMMFGVPTAINAGDAMLIKVFEVASQGGLPDVTKIRILQAIAKRAYQVTWGQAYEFHLREQPHFTEDQVLSVLESKTSALIALAAEVGALAGGATRPEFSALSKFGEQIGLGFQIIDDVLNVVGEEGKYGKEIGGDIREGKRTVMAAHLVANATQQDKERFLQLLGRRNITPTEISEAVALYEKYGSIRYARQEAERFIDLGLRRLRSLGKNRAVEELVAIAKFMVERKF